MRPLCESALRFSCDDCLRKISGGRRKSFEKTRNMNLWLLISLPLYILDELTKWFVLAHISTDELIPVIPGFFNLVQVHNTGAATLEC